MLVASAEEARLRVRDLAVSRDTDALINYIQNLRPEIKDSPPLILAIAQALQECGATQRAAKWFERIKPEDKPYDQARAGLARMYNLSGDYDRVLDITGEYPVARITEPLAWMRTRALTMLGRTADAMAFVDQYDTVRGASANLLEAAASAAIAGSKWPLALAYLDRAIALSADRRLTVRRGVVLFHLDRPLDCIATLRTIGPDDDAYAGAQIQIARAQHRVGDTEAMMETCRGILGREPTNEFALDTLISHFIEHREYAEARIWYDKATVANPGRFPPDAFEFQVLERQSRLKKAVQDFRTAESVSTLGEELKERIVTAHYLSGQGRPARAIADTLKDGTRRLILRDKINLAGGRGISSDYGADGLEAALVKALHAYSEQRFEDCVSEMDALIARSGRDLGLDNFRDLARSRMRLPHGLFDPVDRTPAKGDLPVIQQLWVGSELSYIERLSIRSFVACGHQTHLYTYDEAIEVPPGCVVKDAREILPETEIFAHSSKTRRSKGSLAGFADLFRWKLVHQKGGAWADCDVICLRPIDSPAIISTELARVGPMMLPGVTNCFFAAPAGEGGFAKAFARAHAANRDELLWGEIGIHMMAELVAAERWGERLTAPSDICPIPSFRIIDAIEGAIDVEKILADSGCRAVHLYNEVMRVVGMNKNGPFKENGLIGQLERRVSRLESDRAAAAGAARTVA